MPTLTHIAHKILMDRFYKNAYSCRNVSQIFLNCWHDVKKRRFDVFFIRSTAVAPPCWLPLFRLLYCCYWPTEGGRCPAGWWSTVQYGTSQNSSQFPVPSWVWGWRVLSRKFLKPKRSITHQANTREVSLVWQMRGKKLSGPQYLSSGTPVQLGLSIETKMLFQNLYQKLFCNY